MTITTVRSLFVTKNATMVLCIKLMQKENIAVINVKVKCLYYVYKFFYHFIYLKFKRNLIVINFIYKGCYKNKYYESNSQWIDENDPCKIFKCSNGVITESLINSFSCNNSKASVPKPSGNKF